MYTHVYRDGKLYHMVPYMRIGEPGNSKILCLAIVYTALSKNFSILPGLYCPVESANEILRHTSKPR